MDVVGSRQVFANEWLSVREDDVRSPDGSHGTRTVVESADIALAVPLDGDRLHLVEQHRHPVGGRRWEFPSGSVEDRDDGPPAVAARELGEETGLRGGRLISLGTLEITPSTMSQRCHVFLATELTAGTPSLDAAEQDLRSRWWTRAEVEQMIGDGVLADAKSTAAYALLLLHERRTGQVDG